MADLGKVSFQEAAQIMGEEMGINLADSQRQVALPFDSLNPRESLEDYIQYVHRQEPAPHHRIVIEKLQDESIRKLLIIQPPGHAKTTVAGIAYPSWKLGKNVERHFLYYGNTQTQAKKQSLAIRDMIAQDERYHEVFPHVRRTKTKGWGADSWYLDRPNAWDKDPTMLALGIDGPGLGSRCDEIIFDDVCDVENMATPESRKKVRDKVVAVAFSRQSGVSKNTRMVAVMTRWHAEDLADLFEQEGFHVLWMPALGYWEYVRPREPITLSTIDEQLGEDLLRLNSGRPLWEAEHPRESFETLMANSPDIFNLEYQGLATAPGGNQFTDADFHWWGEAEGAQKIDPFKVRGIFQYWDTASKRGTDNDFTACETWAWCTDGFYMLEVYQEKLEFPEICDAVEARLAQMYSLPTLDGSQVVQFTARMSYVESTGTNNGASVVQTLRKKRLSVVEAPVAESKVERAGMAISTMRTKPTFFAYADSAYKGTTKKEFLDQHKAFPRARHDDMVDVTSAAMNHLGSYPVTTDGEWKSRLAGNEGLTKRPSPGMVGRTQTVGRLGRSSSFGGGARRHKGREPWDG